LTRVGVSTIAKAGLGLFAGEFIAKGAFIIKYLGELVDS
jgi:SET domain-containing protein